MAQKKKKEIKGTDGFIEIPFGAFDSETIGWTYTIPEGFTAKIEDGKIIVEKKEIEDEKIREEINTLYSEIDACISKLLKARTDKDAQTEGRTLFEMEGLMVATLQDLSCIKDYLEKYKDFQFDYPGHYFYDGEKMHFCGNPAMEEKQKEQKPIQDNIEKEYVRTLKSLISDFLRGKDEVDREYYQKIYDWLDGRHIEQKPAEIDEYEIIKKHITEDSLSSEANKRLKECGWYVTDEKPAEWSEEDLLNLDNIIWLCENCEKGIETTWIPSQATKIKTLMKSIKEGFVQKSAEWSEKDDALLKEIVSFFKNGTVKLQHDLDLYARFLENKLKSLRPQPHWKPSEEQMGALNSIILNGSFTYVGQAQDLISLKDELKKLM